MFRCILVVVLATIPVDECLAWGAEGHRIVAAVAADELTPAARAQVAQLLDTDNATAGMVAISTWADEIRRQHPNTSPWHFVDIPLSAPAYNAARDCLHDNCVVAQIERDARIVGDSRLSTPARAEALRFLIHFVGDIAQPLHDENNGDRGGNRVQVIFGRRHTNLHAVWDVDVVRALGRDPEKVATRLEHEITRAERREWSASTTAQWANEAHQIARREIYDQIAGQGGADNPIALSLGYGRRESFIAAQQLEKAGVRLATMLNMALL